MPEPETIEQIVERAKDLPDGERQDAFWDAVSEADRFDDIAMWMLGLDA